MLLLWVIGAVVLALVLFSSTLAVVTILERPKKFDEINNRTTLLPTRPNAFITGANRGIGFQTARKLAQLGCKVIIGCRDVKKGNTAAESIKKDFIEADVSVVALDLSSLKSVETCVNALKGQVGEGNIDLLVNNAGAMVAPSVSADGFDCQYQTNYLGHFALTQWMLDERLFSTNARIINVGSVMYLFASGDLKKTMLSGARGRVMQYCCTKLMNLLFTLELNRRLDSKFQALCVHPGMVATDFIDHFIPRWLRTISTPMLESFQITPEESAHAIVNACLGKSLDGASGVYLNLCDIKAPSTLASSESLAKELWETSQQQITRNNHES
eukprot:TRINITY_DN6062_c0_g1_i2.p1 TRINITY_DN6062_c0_g1~~TRINITY_DN6062_c0_g1_i2.p1  ORF type:complete len:329 (+),score=89.73 TRINITY_DN6062_c0_g1_i2:43-1029(+)